MSIPCWMPSAQSLVNWKGSFYLCGDIHGNTDFYGNLIAYTFDHPEYVLCYLYNGHHLTEVYEIFIGYEFAFSQDLLSDCSVSYHSFYQKLNESKYPDYLVSFKNSFLETIDRKIECYREGE